MKHDVELRRGLMPRTPVNMWHRRRGWTGCDYPSRSLDQFKPGLKPNPKGHVFVYHVLVTGVTTARECDRLESLLLASKVAEQRTIIWYILGLTKWLSFQSSPSFHADHRSTHYWIFSSFIVAQATFTESTHQMNRYLYWLESEQYKIRRL